MAVPLLVFADDWGRHPSSCQHLMRQLLPRYPITWVNTIGTRKPKWDWATLKRAGGKLRQWLFAPSQEVEPLPMNLQVLNPRMWPYFTKKHDRWLNRQLLLKPLRHVIAGLAEPPIAISTLPIVADLMGPLPVHRWIYYCVDDFSQWPGLDGQTMSRMEAEVIGKADRIIAVSENLQQRIRSLGRESELLTHGVDLDFWIKGKTATVPLLEGMARPLILFWGVIDRRMDMAFLTQLSKDLMTGTIVLIGPEQEPDPQISKLRNVVRLGSVPFGLLPSLAHQGTVLIMPYADLPVTRAMQPLKLKEYLATGKPVVVRDLPANREWADCLDLADTPEAFSQTIQQRLHSGLPTEQRHARDRLRSEGWPNKAAQLERWIL